MVKLDEVHKLAKNYENQNDSLDKVKRLEIKLIMSRTQLERLSSAKLDHVQDSLKPNPKKTILGHVDIGYLPPLL